MARKTISAGLFAGVATKMSEGYYSGDKPNPRLHDFVVSWAKPYDPRHDHYRVAEYFNRITTNRSTPLFLMHSYWSKKPHAAIRAYIEHYTQPGDVVLDPFCGTGGTAVMALSLDRAAIATDLSPAATFITRGYCTPVDIPRVRQAFDRVLLACRDKGNWLYETRTPTGRPARILAIHSSLRIRCPKCLNEVSLLSCKEADGERICPTPRCGEPIKTSGEKCGYQDDFIEYTTDSGRRGGKVKPFPTDPKSFDCQVIGRLRETRMPKFAAEFRFPEKARIQSFPARGINTLQDLYSSRNWIAMNILRDEIMKEHDDQVRHSLLLMFTAICLKTSKCMGLNSDGAGRVQKHGLSPQSIALDVNVFDFFEIAWTYLCNGWHEINSLVRCNKLAISTQDARTLDAIPPNSIDYVFTDPPYGDRVQFWESNVIWELWLGADYRWKDKEIIVNRVRDLSEKHWQAGIRQAAEECFRVLKPGRWITLTYNDDDLTWTLLQDAMLEVGFVPDTGTQAVYMETRTKSEKQMRRGEDNTVRDLVINFRKPLPSELPSVVSDVIADDDDGRTMADKVRSLIVKLLSDHPGLPKADLRDHVISHLVRRGALEPHDFDLILDGVAEPAADRVDHWFLKASIESDLIDTSESAKEDAAAQAIEGHIVSTLKKDPSAEGVPYASLMEKYLYAVKDKPRRPLAEWLLDYFYKTEEGTYRLPVSEEERTLKAEGRKAGTNRKIKRYVACLEQGLAIPAKIRPNDATMAEWIRACKRSGLYEQGKLLYEKGGLDLDKLPEELMVNVEEDYQVCVRSLARSGGGAEKKPKRGRRKKSEADDE